MARSTSAAIRTLAVLLLAGSASAANLSGASLSPPTLGGGSAVVAKIDCRSLGQTITEGGSLNVSYATPVMCWAVRSTVNGTPVNGAGWVPETWFDWNWDDSSLGSVPRGGLSIDLGVSVGVVAAHAFTPTTYADACNGSNTHLHHVTLTVTSLVSGARQSGSASVNICVQERSTTWPAPVAYCDDSNCANDPGVPAGAVHGGNLTDLATILNSCDSVSRWIVLEGGVTFTTASTGITMGNFKCLIESYGTGQAKLKFTSTSQSATAIDANSTTCAGVVLRNLTFAGSGTAPRLYGASADDSGCIALEDSTVSNAAGERFSSLIIAAPGLPAGSEVFEVYSIKLDCDACLDAGLAAWYVGGEYIGNIGSTLLNIDDNDANQEHPLRLPHWKYVVIDAPKVSGNADTPGKSMLTMRNHDEFPDAGPAAITRGEWISNPGGTDPLEFCSTGGGASDDNPHCYDVDILRNLFTYDNSGGSSSNAQYVKYEGQASAPVLSEMARVRVFANAMDATGQGSSGMRLVYVDGTGGRQASDWAAIGNVAVNTASPGGGTLEVAGGADVWDVIKNNIGYENGAGNCDPFTSSVEDASNNFCVGADPFDRDGVPVGQTTAFGFDDLLITSSNTVLKNHGVISAISTDVEGESIPQSSDYDAGVDDE